ncbi:hypothetical protein A4X03_0g1618 [Tilletia caries]|uniref:DH domain-containing protein n=1 Tax=Tilletia caries TaxID=13290 RepID=A0A8T8TRC0_9BASI|nr:hypothetical protein A4X03_0g1618 [Tilletia caries]
MASAATAPAPTPPSASSAAASRFSRMGADALSALFNAPSPTDGTQLGSNARLTPIHASSRATTVTNDGTIRASSSPAATKVGANTTSLPLFAAPEGTTSAAHSSLPSEPTSESRPSVSRPDPVSQPDGKAAMSRSYSTTSAASGSSSSSSWTAAARNASMAPYRALAAALPSLLNVSPGLGASTDTSPPSSAPTSLDSDLTMTPAIVHTMKESRLRNSSGIEEEEGGEAEDDGLDSGAVTAWQTPEMGVMLAIGQDASASGTDHQPSVGGERTSAAAALMRSLSTASPHSSTSADEEEDEREREYIRNVAKRPSGGLASVVHVHETAPASDSDWEPDSSDEDEERQRRGIDMVIHPYEDEEQQQRLNEVAVPVHAHANEDVPSSSAMAVENAEDPTQQQQRRRRRRKEGHQRQQSSFFSVSSVFPPPSSGHDEQRSIRPTFPPRLSSLEFDIPVVEGRQAEEVQEPQRVLLPSPIIADGSLALTPLPPHAGVPLSQGVMSRTPSSSVPSSSGLSDAVGVSSASAMAGSDALMLGLGLVDMASSSASPSSSSENADESVDVTEKLGHRPSLLSLNTTMRQTQRDAFLSHDRMETGAPGAVEVQDAHVGIGEQSMFPSGLVASPASLEGPFEEARFGLPLAGVFTPPSRALPMGASSAHSTPATVVPGVATVVPTTPVLESDVPFSSTGADAPANGGVEEQGETAQQRLQVALARAEHRRELQRYALLELVRTERSYADDLALLVMVFFENLVVLPAFAPAVNNGGGSSNGSVAGTNGDIDRPGSRLSETQEGSDDPEVLMASSDEGSGSAVVSANPGATSSAIGSGSTTLQPPAPPHSRSSSYQPTASGSGAGASPMSAAFSRNSSDPALERLDLVTRNAEELLSLHQSAAWRLEAIVSQYGLDHPESDPNVKVKVSPAALEEGTRKVAEYLTNTLAPALRDLYARFCSRHMEALSIVKDAERRGAAEWVAYERMCAETLQVVAARMSPTLPSPVQQEAATAADVPTSTAANANLVSISASATPGAHPTSSPIAPLLNKGNRPHRLVFHDYFVKPIQRIALYPLLLQSLLKYCHPVSPPASGEEDGSLDDGPGVDGVSQMGQSRPSKGKDREAVFGAVAALVGVVEHVNEAGRLRHEERLSQTIVDRIETHYNVTPSFLHSLGHCVVAGTLDVMYHQRNGHPLTSPLRLKYQGCVLYQGFMLIFKVRKAAAYEPKFWFPLWLAKLSDVPEESRFLPHAFRLSVRDHHFELVASNARERKLWVDALGETISQALIHPPGTEAAFPSSLHVDSAGTGESSSRPSSRATQRASFRLSNYAAPAVPGSLDAGMIEEMDPAAESMGRFEASPRKGRFATRGQGHSPVGALSTPSSPLTPSSANFNLNSPAQGGNSDDVLQQYFEETAEIQVRRSSPYQRSVIDRSMAFSVSVVGARAPRSAHDYVGGSGSLALSNSFALATPAHGPGCWQQSLGALVGLGRMGSMETSTLKMQRRKSYADPVESLFIPPNSDALMSSYAALVADGSNGNIGSHTVPFPQHTPTGNTNGMSNRAMRTFRQLSLKTSSRASVRAMSELPAVAMPTSAPMDGGTTGDTNGSTSTGQQSLSVPQRASASRRESFAASLRDALTVSFGRRQRSQSSQEVESESHTPSGTDAASSGLPSGANTPYVPSMQQSPSLHAGLALTPVTGEAENGASKPGRTDSIRRGFGSIRYKRERTLSMPAPPEVDASTEQQQSALGLLKGSAPTGLAPKSDGEAATASRDSLLHNEGEASLQVNISQEDGSIPSNPPPRRSLSRASLQRSRTALGKIWFGGQQPAESGSGFLSVAGPQPHLNRRSTDGFVAARSQSAVALPTFPTPFSSSYSSDGSNTGGDPSPVASRSGSVSAGGASVGGSSPPEGAERPIFFSTSKKQGAERVGLSSSGSLSSRRPRINMRLGSGSHRMTTPVPPLPTLPATPSEESEAHLDNGFTVEGAAVTS